MLNKILAFAGMTLLFLCFALPAHALEVKAFEVSGMKVWLTEDHTLPMVSLAMGIRGAGSASEPEDKKGLAYLTSRLLDQGAGDLDAKTYTEAVESQAADIGFSVIEDMFTANLTTLSERKEESMRLFALALLQPRFDEQAVERVRAQALTELKRLEENPGYLASRSFMAAAFPNHPYGLPVRGDAATVSALKKEAFAEFLKQHLGKDRIILALSGDITEEQAKQWLRSGLDAIPDKAPAADTVSDIALHRSETLIAVDKNIPQTVIMLGYPAVKRQDPEFYAAYLLNHILGGDLGSRLSAEIREKRGLAYSAGSDMDTLLHASYVTVSMATRNEKASESLVAARNVMKEVAEKGLSKEEFEEAQQYVIGSYPLQLDSNRKLASFMLALQLHDLPPEYLTKRNDFFRAVTREQVNTLAKKLFGDADYLAVTVGGKAAKE